MINLRLRKFLRYNSLKHECKSSRHFRHEALVHSPNYSNSILKNVPSITVTRSPCMQNSHSTISEAHAEDADLVDRSPSYLLDSNPFNFSGNIRNSLYPESNDEVITRLKACCSGEDALNILFKEVQHPKPEHLVQTLLVVRDLYQFDYLYDNAEDVCNELKGNVLFTRLTEQLMNSAAQLNIEELSFCILYLFKCNVDKDKIMCLLTYFEDKIKKMDVDSISIKHLCRVCVYVGEFKNLWAANTFLNFLPIVKKKMDSCNSYESFRALTVILHKMGPTLSPCLWRAYVDKCPMLIPKNEDKTAELQRLRAVVRCASFLKFKNWRGTYPDLPVDLLLSLHGSLHLLSADDRYVVHSIAHELQEPRQILLELKSTVEQKKLEGSQEIDLRSASLLFMHSGSKSLATTECLSSVRTYVDSIKMKNWSQFYRSGNFVHHLHVDRKLDEKLSNKYWDQICKFLNEAHTSRIHSRVIKLCIRYVKFNSRATYHHSAFESSAISRLNIIKAEREHLLTPYLRCMIDLLLLYFGRLDCLESTYKYFIENVSRLRSGDTVMISQILGSVENRIGLRKSSPFVSYYVHMLSALNNAVIEFLKSDRYEETDTLAGLFRCYSYLNDTRHTELYRLIVDRLKKKSCQELSSRVIMAIIPCSYRSHLFEPDMADKMVDQVINRVSVLTTHPMVQVLNYVYTFGYMPANCDEFVKIVGQVIMRDKEELAASELIKAVLGLCYYNHLPKELSEYIFNVEFLIALENEISSMTPTVSRRFHENLLQLNRTACLDFPHINTSWFHGRYCQDQMLTKDYRFNSNMLQEVEKVLRKLVNHDSALQVYRRSPYYHKIDFLLHTNRKGEPVDPDEFIGTPQDLRKTAIVVNKFKTSSPYYIGKGRIDMMVRQLEMLEYKVAVLESYRWNSMFMSEPNAKESYLFDIIWSSSNSSNAT